MPQAILNAKTSGKFRRETIDGRSHIVTTIMPIRGNTSMNRIFYPLDDVRKTFDQLNNMFAPSGHPVVNGRKVSARHPAAINRHHIGAFLRNPRMKGPRVFADYVIDETVAQNTEDGKETVRRIENGERVGVSTGLLIDMLTNQSGKDEFGVEYDRVGSGFRFDHVATLLNEEAAGAHAGTELVLNEAGALEALVYGELDESDEDLELLVNESSTEPPSHTNALSMNDLREALTKELQPKGILQQGISIWVLDVYLDEKTVIFEASAAGTETLYRQGFEFTDDGRLIMLGSPEAVTRVVSYEPVNPLPGESVDPQETTTNEQEHDMDKEKLVLALIGNSARFSADDKDRLMAMSESALAAELAREPSVDEAKAVLNTAGVDLAGYQDFETNREAFAQFTKEREEKRTGVIEQIVNAAPEYTKERLEGKDLDELEILLNVASKRKPAVRITNAGAPTSPATGGEGKAPQINFSVEG